MDSNELNVGGKNTLPSESNIGDDNGLSGLKKAALIGGGVLAAAASIAVISDRADAKKARAAELRHKEDKDIVDTLITGALGIAKLFFG